MTEYRLQTEDGWNYIGESLPPLNESVEVLCTMITKASLISLEPKDMWQQDQEMSEASVEVKLWRKARE